VRPFDLFLLGGSYQAVEKGVVVELYGRTPDGEAVVARYYDFRPYFLLTDPTEEVRNRLRQDPQVVSVVDETVFLDGADRAAIRVTIQSPWLVPEYREKYRRPPPDSGLLSCDIPFVHRFLYDKGLGLYVHVEGEEEPPEIRARYTVPTVVRVVHDEGHDITPAEPFRPALRVLAFDIENAIKERTIFTICGVAEGGSKPRSSFRISNADEGQILKEFVRIIATEDPDVITGYNIGGYDFPLLIERAKALKVGDLHLGRDGTAVRDMGQRLWRASGRVIADAWWSARQQLRPKQESLEFVSRILLNDTKIDVDRRNISEEWKKDRERVMEYCEKDADLALRIHQRLRMNEKAADMASVAHLPMEEGMNGRTSLFVDALLIPTADRHHVGVPPSHFAGRAEAIEGGYVHAIKPGIYRWVVVLDFKSMYPSIIISKNICFTTLSPVGTTVSPSGAKFLTPDIRPGIIPEILQRLLTERDNFRSLGRKAEAPELKQYYDGLQNAVKILMNSFYGVLASSFYRFTNKDIGAAITSFARESITHVISTLEGQGIEVVYSDTDSVFLRSPEASLEGARKFGESVAKQFTQAGVTFEFQSVYESFFSHGAKKRYVGRSVWPTEDLVIRGYETRRGDAFDYQSEALLEVFDLVLKGDTDAALRRSRELVQACRQKQVPAEKLVIARSVRPEEQYNESTRDSLPFLRVFKQLKEEGYDVIPGMKVAWIVTNSRKSPQEVEPWIEGRAFTKEPDWGYYADRVAQTLARVTEVFNWDAEALLLGSHQKKIDFGDEGSVGAPAAKPATLDTPIGEVAAGTKRRRTTKSLQEFG
jgi:DNA polymerase, archaea type